MYCGDLDTPLEFAGILVVGIDVTIPAFLLARIGETATTRNTGKAIAAVSVLLMAVSLFAAIDNVARKTHRGNTTMIEL